MGRGWRRAFCKAVEKDRDAVAMGERRISSPSPRCTRLGFLSNPSTPRLRCRTSAAGETPVGGSGSPERPICPRTSKSNPTSPRSPLKLSLFRNSFKFRSNCGICLNSVKVGQGTAIYTAECSHAFHFGCVSDYVRAHGSHMCPVCSATWRHLPLLVVHTTHDAVVPTETEKHCTDEETVLRHDPSSSSSSRTIVSVAPTSRTKSSSNAPRTRSYNDDEPLRTPTNGPRFVPIPEVDDEEEEDESRNDNVEFQGFTVNPDPSFAIEMDAEKRSNGRDSGSVRVMVNPDSAVISSGRRWETLAVALTVKAASLFPSLDTFGRVPIDLVAVLDLSASMNGPKFQMMKRAARLLISSLGSSDRLSVVAFSASAKRVFPLRRMTAQGQRAATRVVERLISGRGSNANDALKKAVRVLEDRRERNPAASIVLLSNGQDDRSHTDERTTHRPDVISASSVGFALLEIPVHSTRFGEIRGACGDELERRVSGFLRLVAQDLRIQLKVASGPSPCEISAIYITGGNPTAVPGSGSVRLGELFAGEERGLLVELRVPQSPVGSHHVLSVRCLYKDPTTQEVVYGRDQALLVPRPHALQSSSPSIQRLRQLFVTTRALAESRRIVDLNADFEGARHLVASARALLVQQSGPPSDYVAILDAQLAEIQWERENVMAGRWSRGGERPWVEGTAEPEMPRSAWKAAEKLAKVAMMKKSVNRVSDLHGFENARF